LVVSNQEKKSAEDAEKENPRSTFTKRKWGTRRKAEIRKSKSKLTDCGGTLVHYVVRFVAWPAPFSTTEDTESTEKRNPWLRRLRSG
jgi:hypothetical protein